MSLSFLVPEAVKASVGCISKASYTIVNLNTLVHDTAFAQESII